MRPVLALLLLALLCGSGAIGTAQAADPIRFCFVEWQPYVWMRSDGRPDGISAEILRTAASRAGLEASFTEMPWKRCLAEVERGNIDAAMDGAPRPQFLTGKHSFVTSYYVFWVREDDRLHGASDPLLLNGRRVSLIHGWWYPPAFTTAPLDLVELDSEENQLRGLVLGRQAAAYGDLITMSLKAERLWLPVRPLLPAHTVAKFYPLLHAGRPDLAGRMDAALGAMLADGSVDAVYRRRTGRSFAELAAQAGVSSGLPGR